MFDTAVHCITLTLTYYGFGAFDVVANQGFASDVAQLVSLRTGNALNWDISLQ